MAQSLQKAIILHAFGVQVGVFGQPETSGFRAIGLGTGFKFVRLKSLGFRVCEVYGFGIRGLGVWGVRGLMLPRFLRDPPCDSGSELARGYALN